MKEIKAFLHRGRAADVVHALIAGGFKEISVTDVKGTLQALSDSETDYSVEFGESVITEVKVEIVCQNERVDAALDLLRLHGHSSRASGWVYVIDVERALRLDTWRLVDGP